MAERSGMRHAAAALAVTGAAASVALIGLSMLRPESVLSWSFRSTLAAAPIDWVAQSAPVVLDTVEQPAIGRGLSLAALVSPREIRPLPHRQLASGDLITISGTGGHATVLAVTEVRAIDPAQAGALAKPGSPALLLVVCRNTARPEEAPIRFLMEASPEREATPTRS